MKIQILILALATVIGMAAADCTYMKKSHPLGTEIMQAGCKKIVCTKGANGYYWKVEQLSMDECDMCCLYDDPHIKTFDRMDTYDWHGTCRYSLAQDGPFDDKKFAVYGDFEKCGSGLYPPSCVDISSYQLSSDKNDVLHVKHSGLYYIHNVNFMYSVNCNNPNPTQVLIGSNMYQAFCWTENGCLNILGRDLLVTFCRHQVCITASKDYMRRLYGLCGFYNGVEDDDHTDKNGTVYPWNANVPSFATSWMVDPYDYADDDCDLHLLKEADCTDEELQHYRVLCEQYLQGFTTDKKLYLYMLETCIKDLCAFPDDVDKWRQIALLNGKQQDALLFPRERK